VRAPPQLQPQQAPWDEAAQQPEQQQQPEPEAEPEQQPEQQQPWLAGGAAPAWQGYLAQGAQRAPAARGRGGDRAAALSAVKGLISRYWGGTV
jgi:outer membrane biosynthesis protein TonB